MEITQAEMIQLLRRRSGMNQGDFGARAFHTSYESGRTKVKNLELGKQRPTEDDIEKMARVLGVNRDALQPQSYWRTDAEGGDGLFLPREVLDRIPGLEAYLEMLVHSVKLEDDELVGYLCGKLSSLFEERGQDAAADATRRTRCS